MRWNIFILSCGAAVVALGFALAFLEGAHHAYEQEDRKTFAAEQR